ncbi:MAG: hypothetical protein AAFP77_12015 [Bacteroidota bacterium]
MNRILTLLACCFLLSTCNTSKQLAKQSTQKFKLEVLQNGQVFTAADSPVVLEPAPFKLRITLYDIKGIMFSSAIDPLYYDVPEEDDIFACDLNTYEGPCRFISLKAMAEPNFNAEKKLHLGDEGRINYWFYNAEDSWHRLDPDIKVEGKTVTAYRTVEQLYDPEASEYIDLEDVEDDIYIVAAAQAERTEEDVQAGTAGKELQREKFILRFQ